MSDPLACAYECPFTEEGHSDADHDYVAAPPSDPAAPLREALLEIGTPTYFDGERTWMLVPDGWFKRRADALATQLGREPLADTTS